MLAKQTVKSFYDLDLAKDDHAINYVHPDCELNWHSSKGFTKLEYADVEKLLAEIRRSYESFRYKISHLLQDESTITIRHTVNAALIERPSKIEPIAHFITIWETKEGKLFKGFEISQLADDGKASINSFNLRS